MLQRDIDILAHFVNGCDCRDELLREVARVAVEQPDPLNPRVICYGAEQVL